MYSLIVENIKCIIAAGGLGTRLQDFRGNKSTKILLDVKGTSMINRQISQLYKWGMKKFVIITNPEYLDMVKEVIRSVMLLVVLLTDNSSNSLTKFGKVKNNVKKSLTCIVYM